MQKLKSILICFSLFAALSCLCTVKSYAQIINTIAGCGRGDGNLATQAEIALPYDVAIDNAGNIYIADGGYNLVRKINTSGIISTCAIPWANNIRQSMSIDYNNAYSLAFDNIGNLYMADPSRSCIRKMDTTGVLSVVAGSCAGLEFWGDGGPAVDAGLALPYGVCVDKIGNMYIADTYNNRIRKVDTSGIISTFAGGGSHFPGDGGPADSAYLNTPLAVKIDASGNVLIADSYHDRIRKVDTSGIITTIAGGGTQAPANGLSADSADFDQITGLAIDAAGNFYISENGKHRIWMVNTSGIMTKVAGTGTIGYSGDGSVANTAQIGNPYGLATDAAGNLYFADNANNRIFKVSGGIITTVAGENGSIGDGGPATAALLNYPIDMAKDNNGNIYVADYYNNRVKKIDTSGIITTVAGTGNAGFSGDSGLATAANLYRPDGIAVDPKGNIYIADEYNYRIRKVDTSGIITTISGKGEGAYFLANGDGGPALKATLGDILGLRLDDTGNIYLVDNSYSTIRKINTNGIINRVAGDNSSNFDYTNGEYADSVALGFCVDIALDAVGNFYISDYYQGIVRKVTTTGMISTFAGDGRCCNITDSVLADSADIWPFGLVFDSVGDLLISDANCIRMVDIAGIIHTIAGNDTAGFNGDGGLAINALCDGPNAIAFDKNGNLLFTDAGNGRIRKIYTPDTTTPPPVNNNNPWSVGVYPNPVIDELNITVTPANGISVPTYVRVVDVLGQVLCSGSMTGNTMQINTAAWACAVYLVEVHDDKGHKKTVKVTKDR